MSAVTPSDFELGGNNTATGANVSAGNTVVRISSRELFQHGREVEIDHEGRIYRLRLTQHNKLILNA
ncbi:MAG: hemin uptake protein HemP [Burkholderiaceae bacterium]